MIRLRCASCNKMLSVADAHAGKLGACPHCNNKVRIPSPDDIAADVVEDVSETPPPSRSERVRSSPSAKPGRHEAYEVVEAEEDVESEEESPPRRGRRGADEETEGRPSRGKRTGDEEEDEPPRRRRSGKRRRKSGASAGISPLLVPGLILAGICLVLGLMAVFAPVLSIVPIGLGFVLSCVGGFWFLAVAFRDDAIQGILCWFVPFYSLYYLITHFEEEKMPFFTQMGGLLLIMVGSCGGGIGEGLSK